MTPRIGRRAVKKSVKVSKLNTHNVQYTLKITEINIGIQRSNKKRVLPGGIEGRMISVEGARKLFH
jgi:hypothetical protein